MNDTDFRLLAFQEEAVINSVEAIYSYDGTKNLFTFGTQVPLGLEGKPKPYLHRIKAVTGAGKTPILAAISSHLKNCIILWTTPRGAVIEQTTQNLQGKYRNLLASGTEVLSMDEALKSATWNRIIDQTESCTIITTTVAAFNQKEGKNLTIHKGDPSPWQQLCGEVKRSIWVFYDEGHNATENQFLKLLELQPKGLILASASPLASDLQILLPGEDKVAKQNILNDNRTTIVDTKKVVDAGLLKRTIEIHDRDTGYDKILEEAFEKRAHLESISDENIIACYIVDRDSDGTGIMHGLHIWERLIAAGANPNDIAVHLSGAKKCADIEVKRGNSVFKKLIATYDEKFGPMELKNKGFKHLIWNLSLEEGWDEPWAYVGYFHGEQTSERKITQRIGRLIRNPFKDQEGLPSLPADDQLRSVYCYLNTSDDILKTIVAQLQNEMSTSDLEVLVIKESMDDKEAIKVEPKRRETLSRLVITPASDRLENELFDILFKSTIAKKDYFTRGKATTFKLTIGSKDGYSRSESMLEENVPTTVGEVVKNYIGLKDYRLIKNKGSTGCWINPRFWEKEELQDKIHYSSAAYFEYKARCDEFIDKVDNFISLEFDNDPDELYVVGAIKLINPNGGETDSKKKRYAVHDFKNSLHGQYNGLNDFELDFARTLDNFGLLWARNPALVGYFIPLTQPDNSSTRFFPDFIVWSNEEIFLIETKGEHLVEGAKKDKLIKLPKGLTLGIITKSADEYELLEKGNKKIHGKKGNLTKLIKDLLHI